jgi:hypothetical protein
MARGSLLLPSKSACTHGGTILSDAFVESLGQAAAGSAAGDEDRVASEPDRQYLASESA